MLTTACGTSKALQCGENYRKNQASTHPVLGVMHLHALHQDGYRSRNTASIRTFTTPKWVKITHNLATITAYHHKLLSSITLHDTTDCDEKIFLYFATTRWLSKKRRQSARGRRDPERFKKLQPHLRFYYRHIRWDINHLKL